MKKMCKLCGHEFETILNGHTRTYCFTCSPLYEKGNAESYAKAITTKRQAIKKHLVDYAGGKCIRCGYNKCQSALVFHHRDKNQKDFGIAKNFSGDLEKLYHEVDKCDLLCANCHAEVHDEAYN